MFWYLFLLTGAPPLLLHSASLVGDNAIHSEWGSTRPDLGDYVVIYVVVISAHIGGPGLETEEVVIKNVTNDGSGNFSITTDGFWPATAYIVYGEQYFNGDEGSAGGPGIVATSELTFLVLSQMLR